MPRMVASSSKGAGPSTLPPRARMGRASKGELLANRLKSMRAPSPSDDDETVVGENGNERDVDAEVDDNEDDGTPESPSDHESGRHVSGKKCQ